MCQSETTERKILLISFCAGLTFAILEFFMGIYSHSQSVLMDAAYDASELIIIGFTLFLTPLFHKPVTEKYPFGFLQVESIFVIFKGFMMMGITLGLSANSIQLMLTGGNVVDGKQISYFQLALGVLSIIVYTFMKRIGKKIVSPTIQTELYGWKIDIYYSCGMSAAFFASTLLEGTVFDPILPYFDQVVAIVIVISVLPDLLKMIFSAIRDIFLFAPEQEILDKIKEVSDNIMKKYSYDMVFLDVTRTGRKIWIGVYINPNETNIAVLTLKEATKRLNTELNKDFGDCEAVIIVDAL